MGATASKKSKSGSKASRSGATATESGSGQDKAGPSDQRGKSDSTAVGSSSENVNPKQAVMTSFAAEITTAPERDRQEGEAKQSPDVEKSLLPVKWLAYREIFVQYIPGKPYALTEFGAHLYSHDGRHEFRALDGTGLARAVGLRNRDVLLSINNVHANLANAQQLAVLECFSDIGTRIGLVVKRKPDETWLFAFHLNERGNRPVVENIFSQRIDSESQAFSFPYFIDVVPVESSFPVNPVYAYQRSIQVQLILENGNRYMQIGTEIATYVLRTRRRLILNIYHRIDGSSEEGTPVAISTPSISTSDSDTGSGKQSDRDSGSGNESDSDYENAGRSMCIKAIGSGPLSVVVFPPYMTRKNRPIPQNDKFFLLKLEPTGKAVIKAANIPEEFYVASDIQSPSLWIASLGLPPSMFTIERDGRELTSREDILKLFNGQDC